MLHQLSRNVYFDYAMRFFDVKPYLYSVQQFRGVNNTAPFILRTEIVRKMLSVIEGSSGCGIDEVFFRHQHKLTEFSHIRPM